MEQVYTNLLNVGFDGTAADRDVFNEAFNTGPPNIVFAEIVTWLSSQLVGLLDLESHVSSVADENDLGNKAIGFLVEVSSLLKELNCPLKKLTMGQLEDRLTQKEDKILALDYLCTELEAGKVLAFKNPKKEEPVLKIELNESNTAKDLREMLISLSFGKPPDNITPQKLFTEVEKKLYTLSNPLAPKDMVGDLLFSGYLTEKQWFQLEKLYKEVYLEYKNRKNLLITRLDVTIRSFLWADRLKSKSEDVINMYNKRKIGITDEPAVKISDVLSATADLAVIEKTSNASVRKNTKSSVNSVIIGSVPDRGGRPEEQQPPPPEVPSWQKNDASSRGGMRQQNQQNSSNYKNTGDRGPPRNHENDNKSFNDNYQKSGSYANNRGNYSRGRGDYNNATVYQQPIYNSVQYAPQLGNTQFGFGGYTPAGDNFQQYGMNEGINQYQPRQANGTGPRPRGGYSDRGSRPFRGQGRGRGRW